MKTYEVSEQVLVDIVAVLQDMPYKVVHSQMAALKVLQPTPPKKPKKTGKPSIKVDGVEIADKILDDNKK